MIEIVLDFKDISTKDEFISYISSKIGLPYEGLNANWDGFTDFLREIQYREFMPYVEFTGDSKEYNEWSSYQGYLIAKDNNAEFGLRNDDGIRDDLKLIFINFLPFFTKYKDIATIFLEIFSGVRGEAVEYKKDTDILVDMEICIKS